MSEFKEKYSEIFKLDKMLTDAKIQHDFIDKSATYMRYCHIYYPSREDWSMVTQWNERHISLETCCSVIEGEHTLGHEEDKLEIMGLMTPQEMSKDSIAGYLTAENVFERIKKAEEGRQSEFEHMGKCDGVEVSEGF